MAYPQYYLMANVTKAQLHESPSMKKFEWGVEGNQDFEFWLMILLLDIEHQKEGHQKGASTLENLCFKSLAEIENRENYTKLLPSLLERKADTFFLSQQLVGKWARDRLILTGDCCEYGPFPPNGDWEEGNLFSYAAETFTDSQVPEKFYPSQTLKKTFQGKELKVVNLDRKQYLDPKSFESRSIIDCIMAGESHQVMVALVIALLQSHTRESMGKFPPSQRPLGIWAGDKIAICTSQQVEKFQRYKDVSKLFKE